MGDNSRRTSHHKFFNPTKLFDGSVVTFNSPMYRMCGQKITSSYNFSLLDIRQKHDIVSLRVVFELLLKYLHLPEFFEMNNLPFWGDFEIFYSRVFPWNHSHLAIFSYSHHET